MNMERSQGSTHEHNDITADLNVNVNAFERRLAPAGDTKEIKQCTRAVNIFPVASVVSH